MHVLLTTETKLYNLFPCLNRSRTHLVAVCPVPFHDLLRLPLSSFFSLQQKFHLMSFLTILWMTYTADLKTKINNNIVLVHVKRHATCVVRMPILGHHATRRHRGDQGTMSLGHSRSMTGNCLIQ